MNRQPESAVAQLSKLNTGGKPSTLVTTGALMKLFIGLLLTLEDPEPQNIKNFEFRDFIFPSQRKTSKWRDAILMTRNSKASSFKQFKV